VAALAYIVGHLVRVVSSSVVPSTIVVGKSRRAVSDYVLDHSNKEWPEDFKLRLQQQVHELFNISLEIDKDGGGLDELSKEISKDRNTAFFQARSYLVAKDSAAYVEQFEGMYSMMRGLGCCFWVGAVYFAGWWISLYSGVCCVATVMKVVTVLGLAGTLWFSLWPKLKDHWKKVASGSFWLVSFCSLGFWMGVGSTRHYLGHLPHPNVRSALLGGVVIMVLAAIKCFSAYREFADLFAETVWRDFSTCVAYGSNADAKKGPGGGD
jgi:hypothetical protein